MFLADEKRYEKMIYNKCGKSSQKLSQMALSWVLHTKQ